MKVCPAIDRLTDRGCLLLVGHPGQHQYLSDAPSKNVSTGIKDYWTVVIPPAPLEYATKWHSAEWTLTRGAFANESEAIHWAREQLNGAPYSLRLVRASDEEDLNG